MWQTCASLLLANGVPMKQIQIWLGHSTFSTTADIYAHLDYSAQIETGDVASAMFEKSCSPEPCELSQSRMNFYTLQTLALESLSTQGFTGNSPSTKCKKTPQNEAWKCVEKGKSLSAELPQTGSWRSGWDSNPRSQ